MVSFLVLEKREGVDDLDVASIVTSVKLDSHKGSYSVPTSFFCNLDLSWLLSRLVVQINPTLSTDNPSLNSFRSATVENQGRY